MNLTERDRKIVVVLVPILVAAAYWFLLLAPKREEASTAATTLEEQEQRVDTARAAIEATETAEQGFDASYAQIVRLGKAIPATVDMPSLLVQLDAAAAGTGITFTRIATGARAPVATAPAAPAPASSDGTTPVDAGGAPAQSAPGSAVESANDAQQTADSRSAAAEQSGVAPADAQTSTSTGNGGLPVGGGAAPAGAPTATDAAPGLEAVPLQLEFVGNFFNLADFFHRVKRFVRVANEDVVVSGRLLTVEGVNWSSDSQIFPRIRAELTATIYLSPKAQGVTAGATPQGPAPTTPAGTTTTPAGETSDPAAAPAATATP